MKTNQSLIVRGAPQEYECRHNAWQDLPEHLERRNIKKVLVLHGEKSWKAAQPYFPQLTSFQTQFLNYGTECSDQKIREISVIVKEDSFEAVISVGGGKVTDLGKAAAFHAHVPVIILPTLAATCAAYTPLSVIYDEAGEMVRYDIFPVSNALVLIEPMVILNSPEELMVAGIGDTLAKWYEANAMISQLDYMPIEVQVAEYAAKQCQRNLLAYSEEALQAMKKQQVNQAFLNIIETIILLGGMVGGYGDEYGRTAGAHSIHDALTILPDSHSQLHGNKVAYGIFVQLAIEEKWQEIAELKPFYRRIGLPISLADLGLGNITEEDYRRIAQRATLPNETIHYLKENITEEVVIESIKNVEISSKLSE